MKGKDDKNRMNKFLCLNEGFGKQMNTTRPVGVVVITSA